MISTLARIAALFELIFGFGCGGEAAATKTKKIASAESRIKLQRKTDWHI
ncbi:hypothetical protein SAMN05421856_102477 [Chryseobacterium taichungense]|uniref:Uncharacterized protein n=1 Tax=Chryseobacterium taichungense TaxID=295069 RepID=A0A1H7XJ51_9FLAO|nr:hypothetical protein [Chryseobacterium taichungense]SEM33781.1 hypothetical protein SAMN05421856_102477 [Chryseobacterium taichungense]